MTDSANPMDILLAQAGLDQASLARRTAPALRQWLRTIIPPMEAEAVPVDNADDIELDGPAGPLRLRVYQPFDAMQNGAGLVFFHGGGYTTGDLDTHDRLCRRLAAVSGVRIASVDYRLAPEHKFPAAVDDALAALDAIVGGGLSEYGFSNDALAVGGDSAGGGLAAVLAQARRSQLRFQLLIYPLLQLVEVKKDRPRWQDGPLLSSEMLRQIQKQYLTAPQTEAGDLRVSPLLNDNLTGLPPAYIVAAELDPLLDEGKAYADRLAASGVAVERVLYTGVPHAFFNMSKIVKPCIPAIEAAGRALAKALG
ncbi:MAG: alpha/beta hydrolase [Pseudomonadota bacterium]